MIWMRNTFKLRKRLPDGCFVLKTIGKLDQSNSNNYSSKTWGGYLQLNVLPIGQATRFEALETWNLDNTVQQIYFDISRWVSSSVKFCRGVKKMPWLILWAGRGSTAHSRQRQYRSESFLSTRCFLWTRKQQGLISSDFAKSLQPASRPVFMSSDSDLDISVPSDASAEFFNNEMVFKK